MNVCLIYFIKNILDKVKEKKRGGASSNVYVVEDANGNDFVMKVIDLGPITSPSYNEDAEKVHKEFMTGKKLGSTSPFLVKIEKCIIEEDYCFLIMENCSGGDLEELLKSKGKLPPDVFFLFIILYLF
jgi:serine/threonine protein kinase